MVEDEKKRNFHKYNRFFILEKMQIKEELNISKKCGAVPPVWCLSSVSSQAPNMRSHFERKEKTSGEGGRSQRAKIKQGSLASEAPSEATLAFILPRLVTAPRECHLSFKCGSVAA